MGAKIIGKVTLIDSKIISKGENNVVYIDNTDGELILKNSKIKFHGNNSLLYIHGGGKKPVEVLAGLCEDSSIYIGKNPNFHDGANLHLLAAEQQNIFIGNHSLISLNVWIRTSDAHPIYSVETKERLNFGKSIIIGDRVWIGQDVTIIKGTIIGSGAIIGIGSILTGKNYSSNTAYAGVPAKMVSEEGGTFFVATGANKANTDKLEKMKKCENSDKFIFSPCQLENNPLEELKDFYSKLTTVEEKIAFYKKFSKNKNRFYVSSKTIK